MPLWCEISRSFERRILVRELIPGGKLPTVVEAELLRIPQLMPLLIHPYLNIDGLGRPLEYGISRSATEVEIDFPEPERG